jgi:hypothetical protein
MVVKGEIVDRMLANAAFGGFVLAIAFADQSATPCIATRSACALVISSSSGCPRGDTNRWPMPSV